MTMTKGEKNSYFLLLNKKQMQNSKLLNLSRVCHKLPDQKIGGKRRKQGNDRKPRQAYSAKQLERYFS